MINREYKDRLFVMLFGSEEYKDNILSLYNALYNTNYTNTDDVEITTINDVIYIRMKNDISLIIDNYLSLWEQQSSYNPNMPLRGLMYFGELYAKYVEQRHINIYKSSLQPIPTPKYVVFYNGEKDTAPIVKLKLSDSFIIPDNSGEFEWTATMYNINSGKNDNLLNRCKPLYDYMFLINKIRKYQKEGNVINTAVDLAINDCISNNVLVQFLKEHRAEVKLMCLREFDEKAIINDAKEDGYDEGFVLGKKQGKLEATIQALKSLKLTDDVIIEQLIKICGLSRVEAEKYLSEHF